MYADHGGTRHSVWPRARTACVHTARWLFMFCRLTVPGACRTWMYVRIKCYIRTCNLFHTQSVDIYAFGIFMWEVFTQKAPYQDYAGNGFAVSRSLLP